VEGRLEATHASIINSGDSRRRGASAHGREHGEHGERIADAGRPSGVGG
jgi:hypothetical protein